MVMASSSGSLRSYLFLPLFLKLVVIKFCDIIINLQGTLVLKLSNFDIVIIRIRHRLNRACFVGLNLHLLILLYYFSLGIDLTLIDTFKYLGSNYEHMFA